MRAEAGGFEPPVREPVRQFSKLLVSATHPNFLGSFRDFRKAFSLKCGCKGNDYFPLLQIFFNIFFVVLVFVKTLLAVRPFFCTFAFIRIIAMAVEETRWAILYCPRKGIYHSGRRWEKVQKELDAQGVKYDFVQSESTDSVERLMSMLIHNGYTTIIIMGGDTALNDGVNCLMREPVEVRQKVALGVIPNGTLNDFARFWGFDENEDSQTVAWLKKRRIRKVDLGCIKYNDIDGEQQKRYFLNCVNIGLTADIQNLRRQGRQIMGSKMIAFLYTLLLMVFRRKDYKMRLDINYEVTERRVMTVCVGNALGYGQTPSAVPYSGMLDVSVVYNPKVKQLVEGLWLLVAGRLLNHRSVHPYRIRKMTMESEKALVCVDGRQAERPVGEYHIHIEPEVINFLIPD